MNPKSVIAVVLPFLALSAAGCAGPDLTMRNPIVAGQVEAKTATKSHEFAESHNGLPMGSMSDQATLEAADTKQLCFAVSLHELAAIDLSGAEIKIKSDTGELLQPKLEADPPTSQTYQGLVPHEEQTGTRQECQYQNGQTVCTTKPIMQTTMIPGPVDVFATKGRVCAANQNLITAQTKELALRVEAPTNKPGFMGVGHSNKKVEFRWAFAN